MHSDDRLLHLRFCGISEMSSFQTLLFRYNVNRDGNEEGASRRREEALYVVSVGNKCCTLTRLTEEPAEGGS